MMTEYLLSAILAAGLLCFQTFAALMQLVLDKSLQRRKLGLTASAFMHVFI